ncbi:MAG: ExbD/TolR family protein [Hyphomonadaceae bacterium]
MGAKLDTGVGRKRGRPDINADPNVIPFIDVMLVMLIIFMVTAPIAAVDIKAAMPDSKVVASKRSNKPVWITLLDGQDCLQSIKGKQPQSCPAVFVMEEEVTFGQIGPKTMEALRANNPDESRNDEFLQEQRIYLRASGDTKYRNVVLVMNRLQDSMLTKIALVANDKHR